MRVKDAVNSTHSEGSNALRSQPQTLPAIAERCDPNQNSGHATPPRATSTAASSGRATGVPVSRLVQHPILPRTRSLHSSRNRVDTDSSQYPERQRRLPAQGPEDGLRECLGTGTRRICAFRHPVPPASGDPEIQCYGKRAAAPGRGNPVLFPRVLPIETVPADVEPLAG